MCEMLKYELVEPTNELVEQYNGFWKKDKMEGKDWTIRLFKNGQNCDIRNYIKIEEFKKYRAGDEIINKHLEKKEYKDFLKEINIYYSTRVKVDMLWGKYGGEIFKLIEKYDDNSVDVLVEYCCDATKKNAYSFSTKVFSFVDENRFPIIDSLVVTMIWYYMEECCKNNKIKKSELGFYNIYKEVYELFRDKFELNKSYKEIDIFLWTYASVIQRYWEEQGILKFETVSYKGLKK